LTPPYLVLHREEFAWPHMSPCAPVRSYIKPVGAAPFHPSPRVCDLIAQIAPSRPKSQMQNAVGWSLLCCTCRHPRQSQK